MSQSYEQFGKYILLEKLASGGMAEVFLAKSSGANGVNKFLAVKRILPQYTDNTEFIEMFKEEAKICVNLNHSNVVSIYDFGIERSQFYLVMEYVEGRNLRQITNELKKRSSNFTTEQIIYMTKEVAAGLDHAHRCLDGSTGKPLNITHRDMSPQNIMVSFEGEVKVIDFGIAKAETQMEATKAGTIKGKFNYMSPEQSEGLPIDLRTDVFSLGIVLWELLTGERLFAASNEAAILRKIRDCQIPSVRKHNPSVPSELERIVNKALAKDKTLRYQTAAQMNKDLNKFLNTEYPDFSPQDFSVFIKNTFSDLYADSKRKLVDYAKIQPQTEDGPKVTRTMSLSQNENDSKAASTASKIRLRANEDMAPANLVLDLDLNKNQMPASTTVIKTTVRGPSSGGGQTSANGTQTALSTSGFKKVPSSNKRSPLRSAKTENVWLWPGVVAGLILIGGFGFLALKKNDSQNLQPHSGSIQKTTPASQAQSHEDKQEDSESEAGTFESASKSEYAVTINSDPIGARVFIDGKDTYSLTPYRISRKPKTEFNLKLDKPGFFTHESTVRVTTNGQSISVTLLQGRSGYLNLVVLNGGDNPVVEINGQRIQDRLPLDKYRIPANVPIRIKISNPFGKLAGERTIMVKENERANVQMILTRESNSAK